MKYPAWLKYMLFVWLITLCYLTMSLGFERLGYLYDIEFFEAGYYETPYHFEEGETWGEKLTWMLVVPVITSWVAKVALLVFLWGFCGRLNLHRSAMVAIFVLGEAMLWIDGYFETGVLDAYAKNWSYWFGVNRLRYALVFNFGILAVLGTLLLFLTYHLLKSGNANNGISDVP